MFEYFYNEIFRSVIISFGSLFNGLEIKHKNGDDTVSIIKVPLAYGPTQKFLARLQQQADLNKPIQMSLPRMSFEFTGVQYDPTRKSTQTQQFVVKDPTTGSNVKRGYLPVPYNMQLELSIMTKLNDDALQITEQILPYFQPAYQIPIKFLGSTATDTKDVAIQLDNITMEDDYEGNFDTRRALVYTLRFTAKTYLYGPISDVTNDVIKKVQVGYIAGSRGSGTYDRDLTYSVVPKATKDYDGDDKTYVTENIDLTETVITVANAEALTVNTNIYIGQENIYIDKISGNDLTVKRGQYNTAPQEHVSGAKVYEITSADADLIEVGDDFGFDGSVF